MDLSELRILDLTRLLPGPYATQLLADLGAEVIKIEDPNLGDYARDLPPFTEAGVGAVYDAVNRGKRSVAIDLKTEEGREVCLELLDDADVIFEGFRPGVAARLGVDHESVREQQPDIIYCSLSGFGQTGPMADTVGHDLTYEGLSGILDLTRDDENARPQIPGFPMADMAGGLFAAFSILGALLSREWGSGSGERPGGGEYLDISLSEVLASFGQVHVPQALGDDPPRPGETEFTGGFPWYEVYETADGGYVTLAALEPQFWRAFCEAVGRDDLIGLHGTEDEAELDALRIELEELFAGRSRDEWLEHLEGVEATVGPVLAYDEMLDHPQFEARGFLLGGEGGKQGAPRVGFPALVNGSRPTVSGHSPQLGEHTVEVLSARGFEEERIDELAADGVLGVSGVDR